MHYIKAEQWTNYRTGPKPEGLTGSPQTRPNGRVSSPPASYRALGTKSPVCEQHQQAEREYSAVRAMVQAESQMKLDQALQQVQTSPPKRTVCLTSMYIRPGSAVSALSGTIAIPNSSLSAEYHVSHPESRQRYESASEFGNGYRHTDGRPISANDLLPGKNRPVFLQNYKPTAISWEKDYASLFHGLNTDYFRKKTTKPSQKRSSLDAKSYNFFESSKRHKLIFSHLRQEVMREKSIVVPLGSLPAALQVKGNVTRLYKNPRQVLSAGRSRSPNRLADLPPRSSQASSQAQETPATKPTQPLQQSKSSAPQTTPRSTTPRVKSPKQQLLYRDSAIVTEYRLKMASLTAQEHPILTPPVKPFTTASTTTYLQEIGAFVDAQVDTNGKDTKHINRIPLQECSLVIRPTSSKGSDSATKRTFEHVNRSNSLSLETRRLRNQARELQKFQTKNVSPAYPSKTRTTTSVNGAPGMVKGIKCRESAAKQPLVSDKAKHVKNNPIINTGTAGKTEFLAKSPKSLTLSVFLPRESNETSLCSRTDISHQETGDMPKPTTDERKAETNTNSCQPWPRHYDYANITNGLRYSHSNSTSVSSPLHQTFERPSAAEVRRPQTTHLDSLTTHSSPGRPGQFRALHCELFGPDLCQDCQLFIEREDVDNWQQTIHPDIGTDTRHLLTGNIQRVCPSPALTQSGSDSDDPEASFAPLTSVGY